MWGGRLREVVVHGVSIVGMYVVEKHYAGAGPHHKYPVPKAHEWESLLRNRNIRDL